LLLKTANFLKRNKDKLNAHERRGRSLFVSWVLRGTSITVGYLPTLVFYTNPTDGHSRKQNKKMKTSKTTAGKTAKTIAALFVTCSLFFTSCTKDGPAGPQGPAGTNGNANVQTYTVAVSPNQWTADAQSGWVTSFTTSFDPTKGAVSIFESADNNYWQALPFVASTASQVNVNYGFTSSTLQINFDPPVGVPSVAQPTITWYYKIVVIPPARVLPHVNMHNWAELSAAYNLK
jgi:hypothetical protein